MKTKLSHQKKKKQKKKSIEAPTTAKTTINAKASFTYCSWYGQRSFSFLMITTQFFQNESINNRLEGHKQY